MSKTQKILLIIFCVLFAVLLVGVLLGTVALVLSDKTQGLVGELLGDIGLPPLFEMNSSGPPSEIKLPEEAVTETQTLGEYVTLPPDVIIDTEQPTDVIIDTEQPSETEAYTGTWSDFSDSYFDKNREHRPPEDILSKISKGMTLAQVIEVMGKPHAYYDRVDGLWGIVWYTESDDPLIVDVEFAEGASRIDPNTWDEAIVKNIYN